MHRPYQWCKHTSKPCFSKWLCDGHKTWESWGTAKQRGNLGKSLFCHQDTTETSRVVRDAPAEAQQRVSSSQGLGNSYFALLGGKGRLLLLCNLALFWLLLGLITILFFKAKGPWQKNMCLLGATPALLGICTMRISDSTLMSLLYPSR